MPRVPQKIVELADSFCFFAKDKYANAKTEKQVILKRKDWDGIEHEIAEQMCVLETSCGHKFWHSLNTSIFREYPKFCPYCGK